MSGKAFISGFQVSGVLISGAHKVFFAATFIQ